MLGVNRFNQAGGSIMEDFDNDGLLDIAVTSFDPTMSMAYYRNKGDGTFEDRSQEAGVTEQLGGWSATRPTTTTTAAWTSSSPEERGFPLRFGPACYAMTAVASSPTSPRRPACSSRSTPTRPAGPTTTTMAGSTFSSAASDSPIFCITTGGTARSRRSPRRRACAGHGQLQFCKGTTWVDLDNDDYPDLFLNNLTGAGELYRNNRDGTFTNVTSQMGIDGPNHGFSCWTWDYDNDGWLDIFATCYDRTLHDVVKGMLGMPHGQYSNRLFRNLEGKGFENKTKEAGLDLVFATMGSNYGDFDNDGFLDMYLGTGEPSFAALIPNRMFKNVAGSRFSEITGTSGTGHLQKGHGVACGDWDRDGDIDVFIEIGGAVNGDRFHDVLFQNPGQGNHWLTVKLIGKKTNRAAIGARIKVVTAGEKPLTIHRHVSSGSSFGANPLQQTIGLAQSKRVAVLEIHWPTSGTTQVFRDIPADQAIEVTEFADSYRPLNWKPLPQPE